MAQDVIARLHVFGEFQRRVKAERIKNLGTQILSQRSGFMNRLVDGVVQPLELERTFSSSEFVSSPSRPNSNLAGTNDWPM